MSAAACSKDRSRLAQGAEISEVTGATMTKGEREDLQRLVRQREKVLKSAAKQRSAELIADFENQMGQEYSFNDDKVWAEASNIAKAAVRKADEGAGGTGLSKPQSVAPLGDPSPLQACHPGPKSYPTL